MSQKLISGIYAAATWAHPSYSLKAKKRLKQLQRSRWAKSQIGRKPKRDLTQLLHAEPYNPTLEKYARRMRSGMTPPERILWRALKRLRHQGIRFKSQEPLLDKYIADFYLESPRVVVEVDGKQHLEPEHKAKDDIRDRDMRAAGITVLRFPASKVFSAIDSVLKEITERITPPKKLALDVLSESAYWQNTPINTAFSRDMQECEPGNS